MELMAAESADDVDDWFPVDAGPSATEPFLWTFLVAGLATCLTAIFDHSAPWWLLPTVWWSVVLGIVSLMAIVIMVTALIEELERFRKAHLEDNEGGSIHYDFMLPLMMCIGVVFAVIHFIVPGGPEWLVGLVIFVCVLGSIAFTSLAEKAACGAATCKDTAGNVDAPADARRSAEDKD